MGRVAFLFPGQGAQHSGMGQSLYEGSPLAKSVFDELEALRPGTLALCFSGSAEDLAETKNTQPCLFACELAAAKALEAAGVIPDMVAGFSLGEVAAASFAGLTSLAEGFALVQTRGTLMQEAAERMPSAMAAILKLDRATVERLCAEHDAVYPVNYNCPGQITVACAQESLAPFSAAVKAAGGRAMPLKVRGGFHSVFMTEAADAFDKVLAEVSFSAPRIPLYSNFTGKAYGDDPRSLLFQQIKNPVRWEEIVRTMAAQGVDTFFEVGPGAVLSGLLKKIDPQLRTHCVGTFEELEAAVKEYQACI